MTTQKSSTLLKTTVSTLLNRANKALEVTLGVLSSKWGPIIALSALGGLTFHEWQHNSVFRSRITSTAAGAVNLVQASELCHLHGGKPMFFTVPENYLQYGGVTCGFPSREGVLALWATEYWNKPGVISRMEDPTLPSEQQR